MADTFRALKLPTNSIIPPEKVVSYLLVPQKRGDKSAFLARIGYHQSTARVLLEDLRQQILPLDAEPAGSNEFGNYYEIRGTLRGPNEIALNVRTIWITERLSGQTRFVTLVPDKQK
jgi:hypothetical protein